MNDVRDVARVREGVIDLVTATPRADGYHGLEYACRHCHQIHRHGHTYGLRRSHCQHPDAAHSVLLVPDGDPTRGGTVVPF